MSTTRIIWKLTDSGEWTGDFVEVEKPQTLRETIDAIRNLDIDWPEDVLADIRKIEEKD